MYCRTLKRILSSYRDYFQYLSSVQLYFQSPVQELCDLHEDYSFHLFQKLLSFIIMDELKIPMNKNIQEERRKMGVVK